MSLIPTEKNHASDTLIFPTTITPKNKNSNYNSSNINQSINENIKKEEDFLFNLEISKLLNIY